MMSFFEYTALDSQGVLKKGSMEAESARHLRQWIRDQGWVLVTLKAGESVSLRGKIVGLWAGKSRQKRIKPVDLAIMTRQLATLLTSGMPVEEALLAITEQADDPKMSGVMGAVRGQILEGRSLAQGFSLYPAIFSELYRATVHAGEQSGHLDRVLEDLAVYTERQYQLRQKIRQAAIYPLLMTLVSLSIVIFLLIFVVPQMVEVFQDSDQPLPVLTRGLLITSHFLEYYGWIVGLLGVVFWFWIRRRLIQEARLYQFQLYLLRLPIAGRLLKIIDTARFARTFAILFGAGVSVLEAMQTANAVVRLFPIRRAVDVAIQKVKEGTSVSRALRETRYFPPMSVHLIASGDGGGRLDQSLHRAADYQEKEIEHSIDGFVSLFEPLMIVGMGAVVLLIVLAILLPIFQMNQFIK